MSRNIPRIPRPSWPEHPNFPEQVLLMGSHRNFLRVSADLIENCLTVQDARGIEWLYRRWISAMRSHEAYEEYKLYPYLARRFGENFESASAGHHELHVRGSAVIDAFEDIRREDTPQKRATLKQALLAHDEVLTSHLEHEEDLVIPLLLELSREEFDRYANSSIEELLADLNEREATR